MAEIVNVPEKFKELKNTFRTGDQLNLYLGKLSMYFERKTPIKKDEMDTFIIKNFPRETLYAHHALMVAIITKTGLSYDMLYHNTEKVNQNAGKENVKKKFRPSKPTHELSFQPYDIANYIRSPTTLKEGEVPRPHPPPKDAVLPLCRREGTLPDYAMVHSRMFLIAWDHNLEGVEDGAQHMMIAAVQIQLRRIIMAILTRKRRYSLKDRRFQHAVGCAPENVNLHNDMEFPAQLFPGLPTKMRPTADSTDDSTLETACDNETRPPITLYDMFDALQVHRSVIASHTVYSLTMERIINALHHPSTEELDEEIVLQQEEDIHASIRKGM